MDKNKKQGSVMVWHKTGETWGDHVNHIIPYPTSTYNQVVI
jgi:hypothetical protein